MGIGVQIQRAIAATGKPAADLARFLGVSQAAVSQWIAQDTEPRLVRLRPIAGFFGTTVDWLVSDDPWPSGFAEAPAPFAGEPDALTDEVTEIIERLKKVRALLSRRRRP